MNSAELLVPSIASRKLSINDSSSAIVAYVFNVLKANGTMTLDQLSQKIQRNRSTVFKSLQRLVSVGLVYKTPKTLQAGGKYYEFHVNDPSVIKKRAEGVVMDIQSSMKKLLNNLEADLKN